MRYAIVVGRFYEDLAERLVSSATRVFQLEGAEAVDVFDVPGAYELPFAAQELARTGRYAGVACLGAVIRGETSHYDHVCEESARGIMDVMLRTGVPCSFRGPDGRHDGAGARALRRREARLRRARRRGGIGARQTARGGSLSTS